MIPQSESWKIILRREINASQEGDSRLLGFILLELNNQRFLSKEIAHVKQFRENIYSVLLCDIDWKARAKDKADSSGLGLM